MAGTISQSRELWKQMDSSVQDKDPNVESQLEPFQEPSPRKSGQCASKGQAKEAASTVQLETNAIPPAKAASMLPMRHGSWREQTTPVQRRVQEVSKEAETSSLQTTILQYQKAPSEKRRRAVTEELQKLQMASQGQLKVTPEAWFRSKSRNVSRESSNAACSLIEERKKKVDQAVAKLLEAQRQEAVQTTAQATVPEEQSQAQVAEISAQRASPQLQLLPSGSVHKVSVPDEAMQDRYQAVFNALAPLWLPTLSEEPETEKDASNKHLDKVTNVVLQLIEAHRKDAAAEAVKQQLALAGAQPESSPVKTLPAPVYVGTGLAGSFGGLLGAVCGATSGVMCGMLMAPFTFGLSVPIFATVGSAAGMAVGSASGGVMGATSGCAVGMAMQSSDMLRSCFPFQEEN